MPKHTPTPEQREIIEALHYDPDTGIFRWRGYKHRKKDTAGSKGPDGYVRIMFKYQMHSAAQLAWLLYYKEWPGTIIDHIDRNRSNNRINNLRKSNRSLNAHNSALSVNNTTGSKGLCYDNRTGKYVARLGQRYIGTYKTKREAIAARMEAERAYTNT